jgi:hypothetical protein
MSVVYGTFQPTADKRLSAGKIDATERKLRIMVDSGAYSAWRLGRPIELTNYITFLKRHGHQFDCYLTLDLIPGVYGQRERRPDQVEQAARQSYDNHTKMRQAGLTPIPVVHPNERIEWLQTYLDDGELMIALSVKGTYDAMVPWLDKCFAVLKHYPQVKVHGLSATAISTMSRYPFHSVDSATWVKQSRVGQVPIPRFSNGEPDYTLPPMLASVTNPTIGRSNHEVNKRDYERELIHEYLNNHVGVTLQQARDDYHVRWRVWFKYFQGVQSTTNTESFWPAMVATMNGRC